MNLQSDLIGDMLAAGARRSPERTLISIVGGGARTYAETDRRANQIANALLTKGLRPGDRIAVWAEDSVEYLELYMAAARGGLVVVPVNIRLTEHEAAFIIADCDARALVVSDRTAAMAEAFFSLSDFLVTVSTGREVPKHALGFESLVDGASRHAPTAPSSDSPFVIAYTSGTTGAPKGAVLTHRSVKNIARMNAASYHLPLYSTAAYTGSMSFTATVCSFAMSHLYVGGSIVLLGRWSPDRAVQLVADHRANFMYVPSPEVLNVSDEIETKPEVLGTLTSVLQSASKVNRDHIERLADVVGGRLVLGWGMTEIGGGLATATTSADFEGGAETRDVHASAGRATVDAMVKVVDEDRNPVPMDGTTVGELVVSTSSMMQGYWNRPDETASTMSDNWYYSGDLGAMDAAGYVYVAERRTDLIVSGGINVYPYEVEKVISALPEVREVAVVGVPHPRFGQTVAAAVVVHPGRRLSVDGVIEHCRQNLASYKKPTQVHFVEALPRTVSHKVKRDEVREMMSRTDR